jgi:cold shock CspA family protein
VIGEAPGRGIVTTFDEAVGLGTVVTSGGVTLAFHCTQIADGTRTIPEGTAVTFDVVPGRHGRWEAAALRAEPDPP